MSPTTWEEAAAQAAKDIKPLHSSEDTTTIFDHDIENLRQSHFHEKRDGWVAEPDAYARSMASYALYLLCAWAHDTISHRDRMDALLDLLARKQHDYGHGNVMVFGLKGLIVRLSDKVERYKSLKVRGLSKGQDEGIEDTLVDIIGYAIVMTMLQRGTFELPLAADKAAADVELVREMPVGLGSVPPAWMERPLVPTVGRPMQTHKDDVFVVSRDDVRRIAQEEVERYHKARYPTPHGGGATWRRYAESAFGGE